MAIACVALGSNVGDRGANLIRALQRLRAEPGVRLIRASSFYETPPVGCAPGTAHFLNAAAVIETQCSPEDMLALLLGIEQHLGRIRTGTNSPRTIDLDLLLHGDQVLNSPSLILPHPRLQERAFVLVPLAEIAPETLHPLLKSTVAEMLDRLPPSDRDAVALQTERPLGPPVLKGLRALVTGGSRGIGRAIAAAFAGAGAEVIVHGRSSTGIAITVDQCTLASQGGVTGIAADLAVPAEIHRLATESWERPGGLDILVCNAGADVLTGDAAKWPFEEKLDALLEVDLRATMQLSRLIGSRMRSRGRGCILTIGWDQAESGMEGDSGELFAAVKGAVMCFTRSLARSLAPEVRVNCIAPGWIRTAWGETASEVWQARVRQETPLGIWGLPEDVAQAALWLASPSSHFITGQIVRVNGGVN